MIRFGPFDVDLDTGELRKHGLKIRLAEQPFSILALLLERPGKVITREELQKALWADDTFVDFDRGLNKAVNRLRDALGDSAEAPRYVETLPKRGYRFIGTIDPPAVPGLATPPPESAPLPRTSKAAARTHVVSPSLVWGGAAFVTSIALGALVLVYGRSPAPVETPLVRSSVLPPADASFVPYNFALSPDGRHVAFIVSDRSGQRSLWLRALSAVDPRPLTGTSGASMPFWAADGRHIGFFADRKLKTVDVTSGAVQAVADVRRPSGGTWNANGIIVFAPDVNAPLYRVAAAGGTPVPITTVADASSGEGHRWPSFLPDGEHVVYVVAGRTDKGGIFIAALDGGAPVQISGDTVRGAVFALGHLFFTRGTTLTAQPFDPVRLRATGDPVPVAERDIAIAPAFFPPGFSISQTGVLAFQSATDLATRLTWLDATGKELGHVAGEGFSDPSLSRDGQRIAMSCDLAHTGHLAICTYDLARGVATRVTSGADDRFPVWSADGRELAYISNGDLYRIAADGSAPAQRVATRGIPTSWSRDGRILVFGSRDGAVSLAVASLAGGITTELGAGSEGQLSPDGTWLVHNGPDGIVARRLAGASPQVQIASYGGHQPRWSRDGTRVFYVTIDKKLMAVDFDPTLGTAGPPRLLFQTRIVGADFSGFQYDVAADGRFLVNTLTSPSAPLTLVTGWSGVLTQ